MMMLINMMMMIMMMMTTTMMMVRMMRRVVGLSPDQGNDSPVSQSGGQSPIFNSNDGEDEDHDGKKYDDLHNKTDHCELSL